MQSADEFIEIGSGLLDTGKYEKAIDFFSKAIEAGSVSSRAYEYRGISYYKIYKIIEALQDFEKAVESDRLNHNAWYNKGEIHFQRKEFTKAEEAFLQANEIYPGSFVYLSALAELNLKRKIYVQAINYCDAIINESPSDSIALQLRAFSYAGLKNFNAAIKDLVKIIVPGKSSAGDYNNLGYYYSNTGELRKAENNLRIALELNSSHPYALNNLGYVCFISKTTWRRPSASSASHWKLTLPIPMLIKTGHWFT